MNLILLETPPRLLGGGTGRPGVAVVYATARGDVRLARAAGVVLGRHARFEIDVADHRDEVRWTLPSSDERMFSVRIGLGWRVFDPCEVTRRQVRDGVEVILGYLHPLVRRLSRVRTIEQQHDLEDLINGLVQTGPARFAEGLEVYHVDAQVSSDEQTTTHAATLRAKDRDLTLADKQHLADLNAARSQIDLDQLRRRAVEEAVDGDNGLLLHHLTVHREDTMGVLTLLMRQTQVSAEARATLLEQFKDRLLPEELDTLAELLIQHTKGSIEQPAAPALRPTAVPPAIVQADLSARPALAHPTQPLNAGQNSNGSEST